MKESAACVRNREFFSHECMAGLMSSMGALAFPDATVGDFAVNVLTVLILYGPAYLANTGAMLFGKWIPDKIGFDNHKIDGGRIHSDGNRLLGDGKSWEGLFGGGVFSGILVMPIKYNNRKVEKKTKTPLVIPAKVCAIKISTASKGANRRSTIDPVTFAVMYAEEVLAKAFCKTLIISNPGIKKVI